MKTKMNLSQYLKLGGNMEKINWDDAYCDYERSDRKIISYEDIGETNVFGDRLMYFKFSDGETIRYSIGWIILNIELVLPEKYK